MSRAFDEALVAAGGSLPVWLVLLNLKIRPRANQRELAAAVGIREATLDRLAANVASAPADQSPSA